MTGVRATARAVGIVRPPQARIARAAHAGSCLFRIIPQRAPFVEDNSKAIDVFLLPRNAPKLNADEAAPA